MTKTAPANDANERAGDGCAVSVVIAAYDAERHLARAVESALAQAPGSPEAEIIIVDDASRDATRAVADAFAASDHRIRVIARAVNGGPSAARNAGFAAARGRWIAVLDADDVFHADHLATTVALGERRGADIVLADIDLYQGEDAAIGASGLVAPRDDRPVDPALYVAQAQPYADGVDWGLLKPVFRRSFLTAQALTYREDSRHGEDFLIVYRALQHGAKLIVSARPTYRYTTREVGWSRTRIDYARQIADTRALIAESASGTVPGLRPALRDRAEGLRRLTGKRIADAYYEHRRPATTLRDARAAGVLGAVIALLVRQKLATMLARRR